jgi:cell division protein FtsW (lipid II flippase)
LAAGLIAILAITVSVVAGLSKAMLLWLVAALGLFLYRQLRDYPVRLGRTVVIAALIGVPAILLSTNRVVPKFLDKLDAPTDGGNRISQIIYLVQDFELPGRGLGATLSNGFKRDPVLSYSYEVTLFNLMHKFGLLAVFPILALVMTVLKTAEGFLRPRMEFRFLVALGSTVFLFMGMGNPALYSPTAVIVHASILYLLRPDPSAIGQPSSSRPPEIS